MDDTWVASEEEGELNAAAWSGLNAADLRPVAALLRSPYPLDEHLASALADAIEAKEKGKSPCRILAKALKRKAQNAEERDNVMATVRNAWGASDEEGKLNATAMIGLDQTDLTGLAALLRSGHPMHQTLRSEVADAIERKGRPPCRIWAAKWKGREHRHPWAKLVESGLTGTFVVDELASRGSGNWESVISVAMDKFKLSHGSITKMVSEYRKWVAKTPARYRDPSVQGWRSKNRSN
jgi:hypothetical protein